MKSKLVLLVTIVTLLFPNVNFGQAPDLGSAANFVIFTSNGAVTNTGMSQNTGDIGSNSDSITGFGNINGMMHIGDGESRQCASDLLLAYHQLDTSTATFFPAATLGNGGTLVAGVYSISSAAIMNLNLYLDAQNNSDAVFIFQINGSFTTNASSKIILINGAQASNVFWKVEGVVSMEAGTKMKGTVIANNATINMNPGVSLEGRALSTKGAVTINGIHSRIPIVRGTTVLSGPVAPMLNSTACFAIFSSEGTITNMGTSFITGDIGSNAALTSGFDPLNVTGTIHTKPDETTAQCAADLATAYNYINTLDNDIQLMYPALFGRGLVLTPHTYLLEGPTVLTDTLFLNAEGNPEAVFIIKINGSLKTSPYANVVLINGAQPENVYWKIEGPLDLNNYSVIRGTIICNNNILGAMNIGVVLDGRILTTTGSLTTSAITINTTGYCTNTGIQVVDLTTAKESVTIDPNPFKYTTNVIINNLDEINNTELRIYNGTGQIVLNIPIYDQTTTIETSNFPSGIYYYIILTDNELIQTGKIVSTQ